MTLRGAGSNNPGMTIGSRIIRAREARGWNQKTLATLLEMQGVMSQQALSELERDLSQRTYKVFELAAVLGVNARWLATGDGDMDAKEENLLSQTSDRLAPLILRLQEMDRAGQLPDPVIEGLLRLLDGFRPLD